MSRNASLRVRVSAAGSLATLAGLLLLVAPPEARAACGPLATELLGTAAPTATGAYPTYLASADLNGDGVPDLAVCEYNANKLSVYFGFPDSSFESRVRFVRGPMVSGLQGARDCTIADFDEDGVPDIAVAALNGNGISVTRGSRAVTGYALSQPVTYPTGGPARCVVSADFDDDGILDLASGCDDRLVVFKGLGTGGVGNGTFSGAQVYNTTGLFDLVVADLNADGALDLAGCIGPTAGARVLFGQKAAGRPTGQFGVAQSITYSGLSKAMHAADLNQDGRMDLVVGIDPGVVVIQNQTSPGGTAFVSAVSRIDVSSAGDNTNDLAIDDLNHDGVLDVVTTSASGASVYVVTGALSEGVWTLGAVSSRSTAQSSMIGMAVDDFDGDGLKDIVTTAVNPSVLQVQRGLCAPVGAGEVFVYARAYGPGTVMRTPSGPGVAPGTPVTFTATPAPGAEFLGWSGALTGAGTTQERAATTPLAAHAWFTTSPSAPDVQVEGNGSVLRSLSLPRYSSDGGLLLIARPVVGNTFEGWSGDTVSTDSILSISTSSGRVVKARFVPLSFRVYTYASPGDGGTISLEPNLTLYPSGSTLRLTATPAFGYTFNSWIGLDPGSPLTQNPVDQVIQLGRVFTAQFNGMPFPIEVTMSGLGTVYGAPSSGTAPYHSELNLYASPEYGQHFVGWTGDVVATSQSIHPLVTGPMHITAVFEGDDAIRPHISSLADVAADQGGHLRVRWLASSLDHAPYYGSSVYRYYVWRLVPVNEALALLSNGGARWEDPDDEPTGRRMRAVQFNSTPTYWEYVSTTPASGVAAYTADVPSASDSSLAGRPMTRVFVQARSTDNLLWWNSPEDSACSVDNLAPQPPGSLHATLAPSGIHLTWTASTAADIARYRAYRGASADFVPGPATLAGQSTSTQLDLPGRPDATTYVKLTAVDVHDNESVPSVLTPGTLDASTVPSGFALAPLRPNPVREDLVAEFSLERSGDAALEVLDVTGRVMTREMFSAASAGAHHCTLASARALPAGLYFVRLTQGDRHALRRVAVVR